jgi:hypothetical protein
VAANRIEPWVMSPQRPVLTGSTGRPAIAGRLTRTDCCPLTILDSSGLVS